LSVDQPSAEIMRCLLGKLASRIVQRSAAHENWFTSCVKLDTAA
jgi:hypothetical protein